MVFGWSRTPFFWTYYYLTSTALLHSSVRALGVPTATATQRFSASSFFLNPRTIPAKSMTRRNMSTSTTTTTTNQPWAIVVHAEIDPTRLEEFIPLIQHNAEQSRQEPGCHRFDVLRDPVHTHQFIFYELYADMEAIEYHKQQRHYQAWADFKASGGTLSSVTYKHVGESVVV